mmetsp:Transcript_64533/g.118852  ORF Transcript_64533/g.118852 Transcript_64533/m.118852 type:complete len:182 (+) Transcript_64533:2-547(+)
MAVADRTQQLHALLAGESPVESAALRPIRADIRRAISDRQALEEDILQGNGKVQQLEEALQSAERRISFLEERIMTTQAPPVVPVPGTICGPALSETSLLSVEDASPDGINCWRECIAALEGEIRRKSLRALELHQKVHGLENQMRQQLQANDDNVNGVHQTLQCILDRLDEVPSSVTCWG